MWKYVASGVCVLALAVTAALTYPRWSSFLENEPGKEAKSPDPNHDHEEHVKLSPQARENLKIRVEKVSLRPTHWRTLAVPGMVVERQGSCERLVSAPVGGVVKAIFPMRGDLVHPGQPLYSLELVSELLHSQQANLFKARRELEIWEKEKLRLSDISSVLPKTRLIEVENQLHRQNAAIQALEHELKVRGFTSGDLEKIGRGNFLTQITIFAPPFLKQNLHPAPAPTDPEKIGHNHEAYELEEMKVMLGEQVQPGQALCVLADHYHLFIEGKVFASEAALIQQAAQQGRAVQIDFRNFQAGDWPAESARAVPDLKIMYVANRVDPASQTLSFFFQLPNQFSEYQRGGKTYRLWRFRPGQRLQLHVPVETFQNVFVIPAEALVREGPEAYVFRDEDGIFERVKVQVLHEDTREAVLASDGSVLPGQSLAMNAAVQLNWAFKTGAEENTENGHHHD